MSGPTGYIRPIKRCKSRKTTPKSSYGWGQCQLCGSDNAQEFDAEVKDLELAVAIDKDLKAVGTKFGHDDKGNFAIDLCGNCRYSDRFKEGTVGLNMSTLRLAIFQRRYYT